MRRIRYLACLIPLALAAKIAAQAPITTRSAQPHPMRLDAPLPPIPEVLKRLQDELNTSDKLRRDYLYRSTALFQEFDSKGRLKKSETEVRDNYTVSGVTVSRLLVKNGVPLTPAETKKEDDRIEAEVQKGKDLIAEGHHPGQKDDITLSRILELGTLSNERRILRNGRATLLLDYHGNPDAKTHTAFESAFKDLAGTIAVDEQTGGLVHTEGTFTRNYKLAGGLLASVAAGTTFSMDQQLVNGEIWLPKHIDGHGSARLFLLVHMNGRLSEEFSGYRRFRTTSVVLPATPEPPATQPEPAAVPAPQ